MKVTFLRLLFLFCLLTSSPVVSRADGGGPSIPVIINPDSDNDKDKPQHAPVHSDVYAVFDTTISTLSISVSSSIVVNNIEIYKDGYLIISDTIPTLYYDLSSYGNGDYTIILNTNSGITYTGLFSVN